jgi:DNA polymerase-3 subunit alpha (Gram-positive type)
LKKGDFLSALKHSVDIDERYELNFEKVQHDIKKGEYLVRFHSRLLPPEVYLSIEKYVGETVGPSARVIMQYRDLAEDGDALCTHIRALCGAMKPALAPFINRAHIHLDGGKLCVDFPEDFGRELFLSMGLKDYLANYLSSGFGQQVAVSVGKCTPDDAPEPPKLCDFKPPAVSKPAAKQAPAAAVPVKEAEKPKGPEVKKDKDKGEGEKAKPSPVIHGKPITGEAMPIKNINDLTGACVVVGQVTAIDSFDIKKEMRGGKKSIVSFGVTDLSSTVTCKAFVAQDKTPEILARLKKAEAVRVFGKAAYDNYAREVCISITSIEETKAVRRMDEAEVKRVELHLHTNMSALDGMADEADVVKRAAEFGHEAVAITDHGVVQAFPRAFDASKKLGIKVIYGMEAYMYDDTDDHYQETFADEYVVFDLETTGFNPQTCNITEIGAVRLRKGEIIDTFSTFVNPGEPLSPQITDLTGITDAMVKDAPEAGEALRMFKDYIGDTPLAAHNAPFDMSFILKHGEDNGITFDNACLDTLWLIKRTFLGHKSYSLGKLAADFGIELRHHRALDDATATAKLMAMCIEAAGKPREQTLTDEKNISTNHIILLCRNATGLFNLYKLVSESHLHHFYRKPRVPKSLLIQHREGLIIGSACEQGELIQAILRFASDGELEHIAKFYDYLEIQPDGNNAFMVREGRFKTMEGVRDITRRIVKLGEDLALPVAATCDAHFIEPQDEYFRRILMHGQKFSDADNQAPLYFRTTAEMLAEFTYLGKEKAREVVIDVPRAIAAQVEKIQLLPDDTAMPVIPNAAEMLEKMCYENARKQYGDPLPKIVEERLAFELDNIIRHGYSVLYYIAYELVHHSLEDGYLVGSRGSVGSSLAATMAGITEVNGLQPHYYCPNCHWYDFDIDTEAYACGPDLPPKSCPQCGTDCKRDGYGIPFATFLGINADKVPDIDLNFSGVYQPEAHKFILQYFGEDRVFRAGTISSVKEQTAYGFVKNYLQEKNIVASRAEIDRLTKGVSGTKRTTGQHPGGLVILPAGRDIHEFTPVQYPANDPEAGSVTTHYNFNSLHDRLVKLDILGHDDPTALRMLQDLTGIAPKEVPINDEATLSLFRTTKALGIEPEQILDCQVGSLGIPEFGTKFVRQMLVDTQPTTIGELVRIAGLSHGTDVWLNNAQELVMNGTANLRQVICTRDDIMNYLVARGMDATEAFYIMESVRKGKGLKDDWEKDMRALPVPEWFIDSCKKIKYMFPRAHAVAYVMMSLRIAYFKVHQPRAFYATYFSVRADNLDAKYLHSGEQVRQRIATIEAQGKNASALDQAQLTILEVALEMFERGIDFLPPDLYKSDATNCTIEPEGIRLPFTAMGGTGESAAKGIVRARENGEFLSIEDLKSRSGISSAVITKLEENECLVGLQKSNQLSLFD